MQIQIQLFVLSPEGEPEPINLELRTGQVAVITGPNGSGKSALIAEIAKQIFGQKLGVEAFFGSRHIQFQSDDIDQMGWSISQLNEQLNLAVNRFRHPWGEMHLKSIIRRISLLQSQNYFKIIEDQKKDISFSRALAAHPPLLDSINTVFSAANIGVEIIQSGGLLRACRNGNQYGIERMSDGERAALLLVCAVLVQEQDAVILFDEPERHLNPAISGILLKTLITLRDDISYVFSTHDLDLLDWLKPNIVIQLRESNLVQIEPEARCYDLSILNPSEEIPETLKLALIGSRRKMLFVEGTNTSTDQALYKLIYPEWNVVAREGWDSVVRCVKALRDSDTLHWLDVAAIIDRDGRDCIEQQKLQQENIACLPVATIENLFFLSEIFIEMCGKVSEFKGGLSGSQRWEAAKAELLRILPQCKDDIVSRQLVWEGNRKLVERKLSFQAVRGGQIQISSIDLREEKVALSTKYCLLQKSGDWDSIVKEVPIKNSPIPDKLSKIVGYTNFSEYKQAVITQIQSRSDSGIKMVSTFREFLPQFPI
jgi:energy-coupling factor transporter ATP-binding protein EcfA2